MLLLQKIEFILVISNHKERHKQIGISIYLALWIVVSREIVIPPTVPTFTNHLHCLVVI